MQGNYLEQALGMIHSRRLAAEQQNRERIMEIESRIPEVSEVNYQMFRTSRDLMQIIVKGENTKERVEALRQQNLQAQEMIRRLLKEHGYPEDYLELHYTCEKCNDTGYFQQKYCTCLTDLIAKLSARELNKSVQFERCSFENFDLNYYRGFQTENGGSCYQAMEKVYFFCQEYARQFTNHSSSILMFGKTGRGKTHLSLAIANRVLQNGYNVLYDSAINFLRQVEKEHFGRGGSNDNTLDTLLSCDLLILDDLGTEFHKQFYQSTVYNIINTRMNRDLPTIISTNLNHNEISALYDERITSRIYTTYTCLHFVGQDVRVLKKSRMQNG